VKKCFTTINVVDFEYEVNDGDLPRVLCMVAYVLDSHLRHIRTIRLWRGDFGKTPPFDIGPDALFVAYSAWAELTCFMMLGWTFAVHVYDLHTAYLAASNILLPHEPDETRKRPRKRLSDACRAYGIEGWERIDKEGMAKDIGEGRWRKYGRKRVLEYCEEDVRKSAELLRRQLRGQSRFTAADVPHVLHWSNYSAKSVALIQARGIPIDMFLWNLVQENRAAVISYLLREFDPSFGSDNPIYTPDGEFSYERFEQWLASIGVTAWPRLASGRLDISGDAFRLMSFIPGIEELHALRILSASSCARSFLLVTTVEIGRACSRSALRPGGMRTPRVSLTRTLACAPLWFSHLTRSACTWIGARKRSELPLRYRGIGHSWTPITVAMSITHSL